MHIFKKKKEDIYPLYNKIVLLTRKKFLYKDYKLSDSFSNRIYLIFFHLCLILNELKNRKIDKDSSQMIFDYFIRQIETNCRELGYGDTSINKKMKILVELFYEILINCEKWNKTKNTSKNNLIIKFFDPSSGNILLVGKLTNYFDKFALFIKDIPLNLLIKGVFNFAYKDK